MMIGSMPFTPEMVFRILWAPDSPNSQFSASLSRRPVYLNHSHDVRCVKWVRIALEIPIPDSVRKPGSVALSNLQNRLNQNLRRP